MAVLNQQQQADYLTRLRGDVRQSIEGEKKKKFTKFIQVILPQYQLNKLLAPAILSNQALEESRVAIIMAKYCENGIARLNTLQFNETSPFLHEVIKVLGSFDRVVNSSKILPANCKLVDIQAIEMLLEELEFKHEDVTIPASDLPTRVVANKRYGKMKIKFMVHIVKNLKASVSNLKGILQAGLMYRSIRSGDLYELKLNFKPELKSIEYQYAASPLHASALYSQEIVTRFLLTVGCKVTAFSDERYSDYTALHYAAESPDPAIMENLLTSVPLASERLFLMELRTKARNETRTVDRAEVSNRSTPMHIAAARQNLPVIKVLCRYGAVWNSLDGDQKSPADLCENDLEMNRFFERLAQVFNAASNGNQRDVDGICKTEDRLSLLEARDVSEMKSSRDILLQNLAR